MMVFNLVDGLNIQVRPYAGFEDMAIGLLLGDAVNRVFQVHVGLRC